MSSEMHPLAALLLGLMAGTTIVVIGLLFSRL